MIRRARRIHSTAGPPSVIALLLLSKLSFPGAAQEVGGTTTVDPFRPDTVMSPPGAPRIVRLPAPGSPIVALRLSIPVAESPAEAGATRILQMLGEVRARALSTAVGAHVEASRTPSGIAYTVVGPTTDLDYLAYLLREAIREPVGEWAGFSQARASLMGEARRKAETPRGRVTSQLRSAAAPFAPPSEGTSGSLERLTLAKVRDVWARSHQPEVMTLLVSGDVPVDLLLVAVTDIGSPTSPTGGPSDAPLSEPSRPRTQVIRDWYGEARPIAASDEPYAEIAALLIAEQLRSSASTFEAEVQLWELHRVKVLTVVGAAYREDRQAMRQGIQRVWNTTAQELDEEALARAVAEIRKNVLLRARTPLGRVRVVGRHLDSSGSADAAGVYVDALQAATLAGIRDFLLQLAAATPARAEVGP